MVTKSSLYRSYKRFTVFVVPVIAATVVFLDWYHTYQWKKNGRPTHAVFRAVYNDKPQHLDIPK